MNLLIITQIIDKGSARLGFVHDWIEEFAKHSKQITVICLYKGKVELPSNVKVLSLGKEKGECRIKYLFNFYKYIWRERKNYDSVFVHMNAIYVVLGGFLWKIWKKKIGLWYVHRAVPMSLKIAEKFTDIIFSASQNGFNLKTKKLKILGHGIDLNKFKPITTSPLLSKEMSGNTSSSLSKNESKNIPPSLSKEMPGEVHAKSPSLSKEMPGEVHIKSGEELTNFPSLSKEGSGEVHVFKIIYIGRISKIKNQKLLFQALNILVNKKFIHSIKIDLIGDARTKDELRYEKDLKLYLKEHKLNNFVDFKGAVNFNDIIKYYQNADLSLNLCPTGGMDKAVLESLASSVPLIVINKAFNEVLNDFRDMMILENENPEELSEKIIKIKNLEEEKMEEIKIKLREKAKNFSLDNLIKKILDNLR